MVSLDPILLSPQLVLAAGAALLLGLSLRRGTDPLAGPLALGALVAAALACLYLWWNPPGAGTGFLATDRLALFFELLAIGVTAAVCVISRTYLDAFPGRHAAYMGLLVFAALGITVVASATELASLSLGLVLLFLVLCLLVAFPRQNPSALDAALKLAVMSGLAGAFFLYGIALIYGATGVLEVEQVGLLLLQRQAGPSPALVAGLGLVVIGLGFGIGIVPFHFWMTDVYDGAPAGVTAFLSVSTQLAGLAALTRLLHLGFSDELLVRRWTPLLALLAGLTMTVGNVVALLQKRTKRLLACSTIAHGGYMLLAVATNTMQGMEGLTFYLAVYLLANLGAFAVVIRVGRATPEGERGYDIDDLSGLARRRPWLAAAMAVFLLSLAGIPPAAGFLGRWYVFQSALDAKMVGLAVVLAANSLVAAYYCLGVIVRMYIGRTPTVGSGGLIPAERGVPAVGIVTGIAAVLTIYLGIFPGRAVALVHEIALRFWGTLHLI